MPTYEYRCTKGHTFDAVQSINDAALERCEVCGRPVHRVLHSPAVHFKGSGFYNTDYGTRNRQREQKSTADAAAANGGSSGASTESTPASSETAPKKPEKAASAAKE